MCGMVQYGEDFNPRSLTGATAYSSQLAAQSKISIHAPSRERLKVMLLVMVLLLISIHAPSRERLYILYQTGLLRSFQSTLPHGSDINFMLLILKSRNFNPRSLTGATTKHVDEVDNLLFQSTLPHGSDCK